MDQTLKNLIRLGVLRESILGSPWYVLYTEHGPTDITRQTLEKELTK